MSQSNLYTVITPNIIAQNNTQLETLKERMLAAKNLGEIHSLITDYTDIEINAAYNQLSPCQQKEVNRICRLESDNYSYQSSLITHQLTEKKLKTWVNHPDC